MLVYSFVIYGCALLFLSFGVSLWKGRISLVHEYHRRRVQNPGGYGRLFALALFCLAASCLGSATLLLFGEEFAQLAFRILIAGFSLMLILTIAAQIKYNGGFFGGKP